MQLQAVRRAGVVIDFVWADASPAIAPLVRCAPEQLRGRRMLDVDVGPLSHPALVARYMRVLEDGIPRRFEQVHRIGVAQVVVVHCVTRLSDGVAVTLTRSGSVGYAAARSDIDPLALAQSPRRKSA